MKRGWAHGNSRTGGWARVEFFVQTFGLQTAEVKKAILPALDPTGRALYATLLWGAYGQGVPWCEISQEALGAACGITRKAAKAALKALAIARLLRVEQAGSNSRLTRYRICLAREAGIRRYWEVPPQGGGPPGERGSNAPGPPG